MDYAKILSHDSDENQQAVPEEAGPAVREEDLEDREEKGLWRWRLKLRPGQEATVRWGWRAAFDEDLSPTFGQD